MFCKNCGTQISDGAAFCSSCGATTNGNAPKIQPTVTQFTGANSYNASSNAIQPDIYSNPSPANVPQLLCSGFACFMTLIGLMGASLPAALFEVMMNRRHSKDSLTMSEFKISNLHYNRYNFYSIDDTYDRDPECKTCKVAYCYHISADSE